MKKYKVVLILLIFLGVGSFNLMNGEAAKTKKLRHVVAFKFKPEVSLEEINKIHKDFHALKEKVPQIIKFEGGADVKFSQESKVGKDYTHCYIVTVKDEKDLAAYGAHPDHQAFSEAALLLLDEVMVVDYWVK